jgi:uncharacterized Tic20 family protein
MEDRDWIDEVEGVPASDTPFRDQNTSNEGVPIPSRILQTVGDIKNRVKDEIERERDIVREYEARYYSGSGKPHTRLEEPPYERMEPPPPHHKPRKHHKSKVHRSFPVNVDENERKWAALAHASTLLTALVALGSGGVGVLLTMMVPLFIYFGFRNKSNFVAFHALQAFVLQLVGTIGWLVLFLTGTIVWVGLLIASALLILVLVGLILLPFVILAYPIFLLVSLALPLGMVIYSVIAAIETWNGNHYRCPYVARWVENQLQTNVY